MDYANVDKEYSRPVWRLADVVAVSARQGRDVVLRCTTAEYVGQAQWPEDAQYVALAQNDDPTPGSFGTVEAWRVSDRKRLVPVAPTDVRCPKLHE